MRRTLLLLLLLAAAAPRALGAPAGPALPQHVEGIVGPFYGGAVTTLGDLTNDGMSDNAVSAPMADGPFPACGAVYVKYSTPFNNHPDTVLYGDQANGYFGGSIAGVGDVNGDGYPDLLVGEDFATVGGKIGAGKAMLYLGSATGILTTPAWTFSTGESLAFLGLSVGRAGDLNGDGYDDWVVGAPLHQVGGITTGAVYVFFGGSGPLPTTPAWTYVPAVRAGAGRSVAGAGDVNGDGYDDLIVGAPQWQNTQASEGAALLFLGHAGLPSATPDKAWFGGQANASFGSSVAAAGDVNGDGYADIIVGAPDMADPATYSGEAFVFHGGPFPLLYTAVDSMSSHHINDQFGLSVATAGDVNGDGYADVIVGAPYAPQTLNNGYGVVYFGTPTGVSTKVPAYFLGTSTPGELVGYAVSTMGDINDDGLSEAVAGCPSTTGGGETALMFVQPEYRNAIERLAGQGYAAGARCGQTAITADVNGDGYDDLVTGTTVGEPVTGSLALYYGGPHPFPPLGGPPDTAAAPAWTYPSPGDGVGYSLANAGDVNGDGYEDFISGAPHHATPTQGDLGMALLFYGSSAGPSPAPWKLEGDSASVQFGSSVGGGGDLNGDGYDDVAVGEVHGARVVPDEGLVKVYLGSSFGLAHVPAKVLAGGETGSQFGAACALVGDVNGDGYDDLVVGAPLAAVGEIQVGKVYVYFGSKTGLPSTPSQTLVGDAGGSLFGSAVARVGDVNGDGYADVGVGSPGLSVNAESDGKLSVFYGSATGLVQPAGFTLAGSAAGVHFGEPGEFGAAGDVNRDGWDDMIVGNPLDNGGKGAMHIYYGNFNGLVTLQFLSATSPQAGAGLGTAVGGAADFDGDGVADYFYSAPGLDTGFGANGGGTYVRLGNSRAIFPTVASHPISAWRAADTAPIGLGLRSDAQTSFRLHGLGRSPAGRTRLALEWQVGLATDGLPGLNAVHSAFVPTGPANSTFGSSAVFDVPIGGLTAAKAYHWRARFRSRSPLFPSTPWQTPLRRGRRETMLNTAGAPGPVDVAPGPLTPGEVALAPAAPNPSVGSATSLAFTLPAAGAARLALYDLRGALVRTLFDGAASAGGTRVTWDGLDARGRRAPAGAYFARLTALGKDVTEKLVRLP